MLLRFAYGLLMGKFRKFFTELSARDMIMVGYYPFMFYFLLLIILLKVLLHVHIHIFYL